ncbi:MAG TPA: phosphoglycerate kinase [Solirubrobacterales bacterium]|nr:phosphoglycerate kinase [Solirubrobacterales bacterium]
MTAPATTGPQPPPAIAGAPLLRDAPLAAGERWIYSAGFNVDPGLAATARVDCELADLLRLLGAGARVAVLAHQGSHRAGTARPLGFLVPYLEERLGVPVPYLADPLAAETARRVAELGPGEPALVGNTRLLAGEEECDPRLVERLAGLGERVALGGFSKAHRAHASNVGLVRRLPGWVADSVARELDALAPWAGAEPGGLSVAVLGGTKREKIDPGLVGLARAYDLVVPAGAVLNALLAARGQEVGESALGECAPAARATLDALGRGPRAAVAWPARLIVAPPGAGPAAARSIPADAPVPAGRAIVDFEPDPATIARVGRATRFLLAGPPSLARAGFRRAPEALLGARAGAGSTSLLLGGDTAAELPWAGPTSSGGGAALVYLTTGRCAAVEALAKARAGR